MSIMDALISLMEVKLDIGTEDIDDDLRIWNKYMTKIDIVDSHPCHIKITFHKATTPDESFFVLRLNTSGAKVYTVKSRTKKFVYGMYFWQQQKQCIIFFSFDTKVRMKAHMTWTELQIQNLEMHRRESIHERNTFDSFIYQNNCNNLNNPPDICSMANEKTSMAQRASIMSGIYEEIMENSRCKLNSMKFNEPPPLPPPRKRLDTESSSLPRTYTSESEYLAKKKWRLFKRAKKRDKVSYQPKELHKRNSISTPDLYSPDIENLNVSSKLNSSNSFELDYLYKDNGKLSDEEDYLKNISNNIKFNFEPSFNEDISKVNLVGSCFNLDKTIEKCDELKELDSQMLKNDILYRLKYSFNSPITIKREFDYDSPTMMKRINENECHYMPMNNGKKNSPKHMQLQQANDDENAYVPMNFAKQCDDEISRENTKNKRYSIDDKIPSYYPNYDLPAKIEKSPPSEINGNKSSHITSSLDKEKSLSLNKINRSDSFHSKNSQTPLNPNILRKYATLDRVSSSADRLKENRSRDKFDSVSISSTLSRLKKLNFSPLREKISNVIQRNNSK
ncbi:unnamed protein product [Chironomus riparius]|uniref:Uncharacterized protein n=1 Tax=Chironomus riparius TaxID=315576 RepID=A0A9N9RWK7_9DIPT|nr:unnamed protein product [Chironomus riparius]